MKRLSIFLLTTLILLCGCSSDSSSASDAGTDPASQVENSNSSADTESSENKLVGSSEILASTEKQLTDELSTENNSDVDSASTAESVVFDYNSNSSSGPDEIELMSYAQTVLEDYFPNCNYSCNTSDYNFVKTNLRYKIEGKVTVASNYSEENFYMIINFIDESYDTYDLISLQIGNEIIYESSSDYSSVPEKNGTEDEILSAENTKIYNEVLEALYADYERDEDSILEELAPNYGMTTSELKEFLHAYMEAYYSN